jgi:hypothetical protein
MEMKLPRKEGGGLGKRWLMRELGVLVVYSNGLLCLRRLLSGVVLLATSC